MKQKKKIRSGSWSTFMKYWIEFNVNNYEEKEHLDFVPEQTQTHTVNLNQEKNAWMLFIPHRELQKRF